MHRCSKHDRNDNWDMSMSEISVRSIAAVVLLVTISLAAVKVLAWW